MYNQKIFMFSGQGSQYFNMGKELYYKDLTYRKYFLLLDEVFGDLTGCSVANYLYDSSLNNFKIFDDIFYTHPAIFMLEYSLAMTLIEKSIYPDYVLGSSLGEYAACTVAGVISSEDAFRFIVKQVEMLKEKCPIGGMIAIIDNHNIFEEMPVLFNNSELTSINYASHFVISGKEPELSEINDYLKKSRILHVKLPIKYAFHSQWIESIGEEYKKYLKTNIFKNPKVNIISCMTGGLINNINDEYLWEVVRNPIYFIEAIKCLGDNVNYNYLDLGPSGTMANFAKYNMPKENWTKIYPIVTPLHKEISNIDKIYKDLSTMAY